MKKAMKKTKAVAPAPPDFPQRPGWSTLLGPPGLRDFEVGRVRASLVVHDMTFIALVEGLCRMQWVRPASGGESRPRATPGRRTG